MIQVLSVNVSENKGTIKTPVGEVEVDGSGIKHDAHAGKWHRQISLLAAESIEKFEKTLGRKVTYGEFAENITTRGMLMYEANPMDRFTIGEIELEVTQIGKECHGSNCAIFREVGKCVMPKEGIFARVLQGGVIREGDIMEYHPKIFKIMVITLSDRASAGEYADRSGPEIESIAGEYFKGKGLQFQVEKRIIPDDPDELRHTIDQAMNEQFDVIITTGGTGIGPRDFTPDVVKELLDKEIPGVMELIRIKYGSEKPNALLSRGVAGVIGNTLVYTLPGSVRAVREYMEEILKTMHHLMFMLRGIDVH